MREIVHFLKANDAYFIIGLSVLSLVLFCYTVSLSKKLAGVNRRRNARLEDGRIGDIIDHLTDQSDALLHMRSQLDDVRAVQSHQAGALSSCLQNAGIVRFNAFDDVGGEQSFSLVLLDSNRNGVAISSLYGRHDSRVYAKAINSGKGERPLSDEEQRALDKALSGATVGT